MANHEKQSSSAKKQISPAKSPCVFSLPSLRHLIQSTGYSLKGLQQTWHNEVAFRQEVVIAIIFVPLGILLGNNGVESALLSGVILLLLLVELLNSAIESLSDRISTAHHPLAARAKDAGSAAVMMAILIAILTWLLILW